MSEVHGRVTERSSLGSSTSLELLGPRVTLKGEFARFLVVGGSAATLNLGTGVVVRSLFTVEAHAAGVVLGYLVGTVVSFVLNRGITFRAGRGQVGPQAIKFILLAASGIALAAVLAEVVFRVTAAVFRETLPESVLADGAHTLAIGVTAVYSFVGMKYFAFRRR